MLPVEEAAPGPEEAVKDSHRPHLPLKACQGVGQGGELAHFVEKVSDVSDDHGEGMEEEIADQGPADGVEGDPEEGMLERVRKMTFGHTALKNGLELGYIRLRLLSTGTTAAKKRLPAPAPLPAGP